MEKRRLRGDHIAFYSFLRKRNEEGAQISSLKVPETGLVEWLKAASGEDNVILCCHSSGIAN